MKRFYDNLIADLESYQKTRVSGNKPIISSVIYANSEQSTVINIDVTMPISEDTISDKRPRQPPSDTLSTPRDPNTKSYKWKKTFNTISIPAISNINDNNMMIVVDKENLESHYPEIENQILLDSECSHHLIWSQNDLENFVANDDKYSLGLGSICLGNGVYAPISGYDNKFPFGRMLVVPGLLN